MTNNEVLIHGCMLIHGCIVHYTCEVLSGYQARPTLARLSLDRHFTSINDKKRISYRTSS